MNAPLLAAGDWFEVLAAVIVFVITGVAQWLQTRAKKKAGQPSDPTDDAVPEPWSTEDRTPPPIRGSEPAPRPFDLEEQIRRILDPQPPPLPPPSTPFPPRRPQDRSMSVDEEAEGEIREFEEAPSRPLASLDAADSAYQRGAQVESTVAHKLSAAGNFSRTAAAFRHASDISESVSSRLRRVHPKTAGPAASTADTLGSQTSRKARVMADLLGRPRTLQQAILASVIVARPKALEDHPEPFRSIP